MRFFSLIPLLVVSYVYTGHEVYESGDITIPERYKNYFALIQENPDIFSGFYHYDLANNILPKLAILRQFGFYPAPEGEIPAADAESCGAHSPKVAPHELATGVE